MMDLNTKFKKSKKIPRRWYIAYEAKNYDIDGGEDCRDLVIDCCKTYKDAKLHIKEVIHGKEHGLKVSVVENEDDPNWKYAFGIDFKTDEDEAEFILKANAGVYDNLDNVLE